jgi:hypothetical protein
LLVETRVKSTLYILILYWSGARHWVEEENIRRGPKKVAKFDEEVGGWWQERKKIENCVEPSQLRNEV